MYVDPLNGVETGNTVPGPHLPFGMVKLSPDVAPPNHTSGYRSDLPIRGFSHNHVSGTGGGARYGNVMVIPQIGEMELFPRPGKLNEYAKPGYYTVVLTRPDGNVMCELTATDRVGMHRYTFSKFADADPVETHFNYAKVDKIDANILIDASSIINMVVAEPTFNVGSEVTIIGDDLVEGYGSFRGGWGGNNPYTVYFSARFDTPFSSAGTWRGTEFSTAREATGNQIGAYCNFEVPQRGQIMVKVAISYVSVEKARENLAGIPDWDFDRVRGRADEIWNEQLALIDVRGGTVEQKAAFYTAMYHNMVMPASLGNDENPAWRSGKDHYWDLYTLWDTYRTTMPLYTLIMPDRQRDIINCLLEIYDQRGWLPDAWTAGDYAYVQGGTSADIVIADAVVKQLGGFDVKKAYEAIKKNGEVISDDPYKYGRYLYEYETYGYLSSGIKNGSSKTLEYAYNDFCIARVAEALGHEKDHGKFLARSYCSLNLYDSLTKFFWSKDGDGNWVPGFSPAFRRPDSWNGPYFYEGSPWYYATYFPHDMRRMIGLHGGDENFISFLDELFDGENFEMGNEPGFLTPWLYHYAGRPDRSVERIRPLLSEFRMGRRGLPGQDDSGAMSAWFIFGAMGFYPVAGQDVYLIGSPLFGSSTISLGRGTTFTVRAEGVSDINKYVVSATLDGKVWDKCWFTHSDIADGAELVLQMGPTPSRWGTACPPPSASDDENSNDL
jgi:predicted alpha-1,2-mannosidase